MKSRAARFLGITSLSLGALAAAGCSRKTEPPERTESEVGAERSKEAPKTIRPGAEGALSPGALHVTAVKAALWGTPIVSVDAMRQAFFRDAGAKYNDIVYWSKPSDWKNQTTTPNASTNYVYFNFNTKDGPVVLEIPPTVGAGLFGTVLDAWQVPKADVGPEGTDAGKGGKYLLIPPGYQRDVPSGYLPVRFDTFNGYGLLRAITEDRSAAAAERALALVKKVRLRPFSPIGKATGEQRFVDMSGKLFDGIVRYDGSFFVSLSRMVNEEPALPRDTAMLARLKTLGIEKGKTLESAGELAKAAAEVHTSYMNRMLTVGEPYRNDGKWRLPSALGAKTGFSFVEDGVLDIEERGLAFFLAYAPPKNLGKATFYLIATVDGAGAPLSGENSYTLHVPSNVPAKQFWAVTLYDSSTAAFVRESPRVELNSYTAKKNADGTVDVHFGPKAPAGKDASWVYTEPNERWFAFFRFYGPEASVLDKSFKLDDLQKTQ